jgi:hypothetical protein
MSDAILAQARISFRSLGVRDANLRIEPSIEERTARGPDEGPFASLLEATVPSGRTYHLVRGDEDLVVGYLAIRNGRVVECGISWIATDMALGLSVLLPAPMATVRIIDAPWFHLRALWVTDPSGLERCWVGTPPFPWDGPKGEQTPETVCHALANRTPEGGMVTVFLD